MMSRDLAMFEPTSAHDTRHSTSDKVQWMFSMCNKRTLAFSPQMTYTLPHQLHKYVGQRFHLSSATHFRQILWTLVTSKITWIWRGPSRPRTYHTADIGQWQCYPNGRVKSWGVHFFFGEILTNSITGCMTHFNKTRNTVRQQNFQLTAK